MAQAKQNQNQIDLHVMPINVRQRAIKNLINALVIDEYVSEIQQSITELESNLNDITMLNQPGNIF